MAKCDWCGKEEEKKNMKYWHTGYLLCISCFNNGRDKNEKMMKELASEMRCCQKKDVKGRQESLENTFW